MNILQSLRSSIHPLHPEGWVFVVAFASATLLLFFLWPPLGWLGALLTAWCAFFFRDPPRVTPIRPDLILAPADGLIVASGPSPLPPELDLGQELRTRISIFMSPFDVHVNRSPIAATVEKIAYTAGAFINASLDKASEKNERNALHLRLGDGRDLVVVQIAGFIARRIVCTSRQGETLKAGERFGIIRFGSRLDVYLPVGSVPSVMVGQRAVGGETVLADLATEVAGAE